MSPTSVRSRFHRPMLALAILATLGVASRPAWAGPAFSSETEPNDTSAAATPIAGASALIRATILPNADVDFYSFTAAANDKVYAAVQTSFSGSLSTDSILEVIGPDGTTVIEGDEDDGSFGGLGSTVANVNLPAAGTYFIRLRHNSATVQLRPYFLHFRLRSGAPTPETEANDTLPGQALPAGGWVSGDTSSATDVDFFSVALNAGDTVYLSLDQDPERNGDGNMQLGLGVFDGFTLVINDNGAGFAPYTAPDSEAFFMTVKAAGTYSIAVAVPAGGVASTYTLSATVYPAVDEGVNCTTYTSTSTPVAITDAGTSVATITVPGNPRIADLDVILTGTHTFFQDLDVHLTSPAGNDNGLFTDVFNNTTGGPSNLDITLDDEAAIPPSFLVAAGMNLQPEAAYRLSWFDGENAGGVWTLTIRDDFAADIGTLTGFSLRICEPAPAPACAPGFTPVTVFSTDFESGAAGFTHSGTADEWEQGLPATVATTAVNPVAAFNSCNSGTSCWKTDLDNTYDASSNQNLLSAPINLAGFSAPVVVRWAHRYQMDTATNDHYNVSIQPVGTPASAVRLFDFQDAVMTNAVGTPVANVGMSAGWGEVAARADAFAGQNTELVFHLDSGTGATNFGGAAIDDVSVTACQATAVVADVAITKTDGVASAVPGQNVVYTITASNSSGTGATGVTVADTFPGTLTCNWTCVGAGGGTCAAAGAGNINDATVNLPDGASVTYTATCAVSASATGSLSNTATVTLTGDPNTANDSATDTDTLTPQADLSITKTDGFSAVTQGSSTTYTIVAANAGPSDAPGSTVTDTFPADLTCNWTCAGAGGGSCTAAGAGNISDSVNLPAGGSVTYTANCGISATAASPLSNTATVAAGAGVTDGTPGNNSATDSDTVNPAAVPGASVSGTKTAAGSFVVGGAITYTITLTNAGPGAQADNPGDELTDVLPATLALVSASSSSGTADANTGTNTVTWNGSIPAAGSVTITINATILPSAAGQSVNNQGTISYDADGNGSNEATAQTDDPAATGAANPTSFAVPGTPADIPTLSTLGLIGMAAFLAVLALALLRRRQGSIA